MTKVPSLNYPQIVAAFERDGWRVVRQKGKRSESGTRKITVPAHKPVKRSTLAKLLKDAEMDVDTFLRFVH